MPLAIRAQVVDLRTYAPIEGEKFFVDTNIWYWLTYDRASLHPESHRRPQPYQLNDYPTFIKRARTAKSQLFSCALTFAELATLIELAEWKIYCDQSNRNMSIKEFRYDTQLMRRRAIERIADAWELVKTYSLSLEVTINIAAADEAVARLQRGQALDGRDLLMVQTAQATGIRQFVTDDKDFLSVPDVVVYTANESALRAAAGAGALLKK